MSAPPYMPLYVGDYLADTTHLTQAETGAYLLLLMAAWRSGGRLPHDDAKLARFSRSTGPQWKRIKANVLAFFTIEDGFIFQRRLRAELAKYEATLSQKREAGRAGGISKSLKSKRAEVAAATVPPWQPEPDKEQEIEREEANASLSPSGDEPAVEDQFETAWKAYPHVRGRSSKPKAKAVWPRLLKAERAGMAEAATRYGVDGREPNAECGAPGMHLWLRDKKFLDWLPGANVVDFRPGAVSATGPPPVETPDAHAQRMARRVAMLAKEAVHNARHADPAPHR